MVELGCIRSPVIIQMETEMIDKLDVFISGGMGDAKYRQQLYHM